MSKPLKDCPFCGESAKLDIWYAAGSEPLYTLLFTATCFARTAVREWMVERMNDAYKRLSFLFRGLLFCLAGWEFADAGLDVLAAICLLTMCYYGFGVIV